MPVRVVESKDNARLKELRKALATSGRSAPGRASLVGIEGPHLLEEALRAGLRVKTIFVAQSPDREWNRLLSAFRVPPETEILQLPAKLLDSALATETPQPLAAWIEPPQGSWPQILGTRSKGAKLIVVLAGIQDPGNLGTILRSAEAFGATGVICLTGTVSRWNPKAMRASAGSVFRLPTLANSAAKCFQHLREANIRTLATLPQDADPLGDIDLRQ